MTPRLISGEGAEPTRVEASVTRGEGTITVIVAGVTRQFTAVRDGEGWVLTEAGVRKRVVVVPAHGGVEVVMEGRRRVVTVARPGARAVAPVVTPPMPAVVARVLVVEGARVERGDALVAVSAMKMEVVLRAPNAGIARVHVAVGDKVMPGDVLVDVVAVVA